MSRIPTQGERPLISRRDFLSRAGSGCGMLALASMLQAESKSLRPQTGRHDENQSGSVKSVIWLFMNGGPSGIDLFDPKPELTKWDGQAYPGEIETLFPYPGPIMKSPFRFKRYGETGMTVSDVFPHLASHVDDLAFLHACGSESQNHGPACYLMNSGVTRLGFPSVGSWVTYGLGTETEDLPGFVVMYDHRSAPEGGANLWDAGFLPGEHQGVIFHAAEQPIVYLNRPDTLTAATQKSQLELLRKLNAEHLKRHPLEADLQARIRSFETAYRMQTAAPQIIDVSKESQAVQSLYGLDVEECKHFGGQLLMARRMVESGVRFVQIYHGGSSSDNWDHHSKLPRDHRKLCYETDRPIAGLLQDLKQRGLLDSTLVVWGGEFGRSPTSQDRDGRDHNPFGFTMWLAGGGVKRGLRFGRTDEFGYKPVENPVSTHDLHATILHLLGLDHRWLTYFHNGRDQSLTNDLGSVVHELIA